jgi:hypothetical protein
MSMSALTRVALAFAVLALTPPLGGNAAQAAQGPWCAEMSVGGGVIQRDCSMRSFEQCRQMVIAGNRGFCSANPRYGIRQPRRLRQY